MDGLVGICIEGLKFGCMYGLLDVLMEWLIDRLVNGLMHL